MIINTGIGIQTWRIVVYAVVGTLYSDYGLSQIKKNAINNLKNKAQLAQQYKRQGFTGYAETTIKTLFE